LKILSTINPPLLSSARRFRLPENCANLTFGGPKRNFLFMTASQSIYAAQLQAQGAAPG
jgi:gluconolactonase